MIEIGTGATFTFLSTDKMLAQMMRDTTIITAPLA